MGGWWICANYLKKREIRERMERREGRREGGDPQEDIEHRPTRTGGQERRPHWDGRIWVGAETPVQSCEAPGRRFPHIPSAFSEVVAGGPWPGLCNAPRPTHLGTTVKCLGAFPGLEGADKGKFGKGWAVFTGKGEGFLDKKGPTPPLPQGSPLPCSCTSILKVLLTSGPRWNSRRGWGPKGRRRRLAQG